MNSTAWEKHTHPEDTGWHEYSKGFMSVRHGELKLRVWFSGAGVWAASLVTSSGRRYSKTLQAKELNDAMQEAANWVLDFESRNAG